MKALIITTQTPPALQAVFTDNAESAIEEIYAQNFDIVIFGNDVPEAEEKKLRKILSLQQYEILVVRQETEPLKFTLAQAKFMLNNYRYEKGNFTISDNKNTDE